MSSGGMTTTSGAVLARPVRNDETAVAGLFDETAAHGVPALVIDTTSSTAALLMHAAAQQNMPVAYVTGLAMRRAAELYAGAAKTDPEDAAVPADYARCNADRLNWVSLDDELLASLQILNGRDIDLAADATRAANRLRDALLPVSSALERAVGDKLATSGGVRDALARRGTPTALGRARKHNVRRRIAKRSPRAAVKLTDAIWEALDSQSIVITAEATWGSTISELACDINNLHERRARPAEEIEAVFMAHPLGKAVASMCGSGPRTGARVLAEIRDPHRFAGGGRLASYCGLAPVDSVIRPYRHRPQTPRR